MFFAAENTFQVFQADVMWPAKNVLELVMLPQKPDPIFYVNIASMYKAFENKLYQLILLSLGRNKKQHAAYLV